MNPSKAIPRILLWLCFTLAHFSANALTSDRNQSISIQSDRAERDEAKGTTTYAGNVIMQQGSMRINAARVVIHNNKSKVTRIIAEGEPATYQQKPSEAEGLVVAEAKRLEYDVSNETLHLVERAKLQQEGTQLSGNRIDYDVKSSVVKAGGNAEQNERVHMVIPARALQEPSANESE